MTNVTLIAKLEQAKEGSRPLSKGMLRALGYRMTADGKGWMAEDRSRISQRADPTRNLQDAVDLVPEGWAGGGRLVGEPPYAMELLNTNEDESGFVNSSAKTPALALCVAILKARDNE